MTERIFGNRYRVLGKIGEGGMATVYQAEDTLLERVVAVKVLREQYAIDPSFLERFKQEARAAAGIAHQNIVSVYDVGTDQGFHYIVMEYVDGTSLKDLITQGAPFSASRAISLILQVLSALSFAHQKGIVHRDIKPQNILVSPDGHVKVTDFGIARAATSGQLTETGTVLGTVHYCSPEQAQGRSVGVGSDLYSAAIVVYEMLTGRLPFEGDGALAVALKHLQEEPVEPSQLNPRVPPQLDAIVLKAMAKDPADRYTSAEEMRQALLSYQRFSDQLTSQFAPVTQPRAKGTAGRTPGRGTSKSTGKSGSRWVTVVLGLLIIGALLGWIPLGNRIYDELFAVGGVSPSPTVAPTVQPAEVPSLVGMSYSDAERQLKALGLNIGVSGEEHSDQYEALEIIRQTVEQGQRLPPGSVVNVVVSMGPEEVRVPDVVQQEVGRAKQQLEGLGLKAGVSEDWRNEVVAGVVYHQEPAANERVRKGTTVNLLVSKGPEPTPTPRPVPTQPSVQPTATPKRTITVPNVVGLSEEAAQRLIETSGLRTTYPNRQSVDEVADKDYYYSVPIGHVLSQQPVAGTEAQPYETVYIAVRED